MAIFWKVEDGFLMLILVGMIVLSFIQIWLRNVFSIGLVWVEPLVRQMLLWVALMGAVVATRDHNPITVDAVSRFLAPGRVKFVARFICDAFATLICALLTYSTFLVFKMEFDVPQGGGWELATATLSFERGASEGSAGASGMGGVGIGELVALLRSAPAALRGDAAVRDRFARLAIETTALRFNAARARVPGLTADRPQSLPLMAKLAVSEHAQRLADFGVELSGHEATLWKDAATPGSGEWAHSYFNTYAGTIAGGTSEILRNVLGEKVLGLAKSR